MQVDIPTVDAEKFLNKLEGWEEECKRCEQSLHKYGIVILKDPRINEHDNEVYCEMVETYFSKRAQDFYEGKQVSEVHPETYYQVGATPEYIEKARDHCSKFAHYDAENKPQSECPPTFDAKWRYFWRYGERPAEDSDGIVNVIPEDFPTWTETMNTWGAMMLAGVETVARMAAVGMGLDENVFYDRMQLGHHLLAPTGSDLRKYELGTIFAGYHYDLNFLTIHGKSPFPGLFIWTKEGQKCKVKVPTGCLIL